MDIARISAELGPEAAITSLDAHTRQSYARFWTTRDEYLADHDLGKVNESEYYRVVRMHAEAFGGDKDYARLLGNYEIHRATLGTSVSARFELIGGPMPSELYQYLPLIRDGIEPNEFRAAVDDPDNELLGQKAAAKYQAVQELYADDPQLFKRLLLTRTLHSYDGYKQAARATLSFLDELEDATVLIGEYSAEEIVDLTDWNNQRLLHYQLTLSEIQRLVSEGVAPLKPAEYQRVVKEYLLDLIKSDEERLNPVAPAAGLPRLPGTTALQSFFESHTGTDYPMPENS